MSSKVVTFYMASSRMRAIDFVCELSVVGGGGNRARDEGKVIFAREYT